MKPRARLATALRKEPHDFDTQYWRGLALNAARRYAEAAQALGEAVALNPNSFEASYWRGLVLMRLSRFREASASLEQAVSLRPSSREAQTYLFGAYLGAGQSGKAFQIFPWVIVIVGGGLTALYLFGLLGLCWFIFRARKAAFPPLTPSLIWIAWMFVGQIAFIFLLGVLPAGFRTNTSLLAVLLPAMLVMLAALFLFQKSSWGEAFRWPLRLGGGKALALAALLLALNFVFNIGYEKIIAANSHQHPVQNTAAFLREALKMNPLLGLFTIGLAVPIAEEIVFRGLIYGALGRWLRPGWVILVSSVLFALTHLDPVFFVPLLFFGAGLGWARWRTGSLGLPILIHAANNCLAVLALKLGAGQ